MPITLQDVPEEILERILALVLVQSPEPSPRPSWHLYQTPPSTRPPTVISPLLVCRSWLRIATPIHYRHPVLRSSRHAELLLRALRYTPSLAPCIRSLHLHATSPALREIMPLCTSLDTLDITVDNGENSESTASTAVVPAGEAPRDRRVVEFCEAFTMTRRVRHLVIRKNAYLTQPNPIYVFEQLAKAVSRWHRLVSALPHLVSSLPLLSSPCLLAVVLPARVLPWAARRGMASRWRVRVRPRRRERTGRTMCSDFCTSIERVACMGVVGSERVLGGVIDVTDWLLSANPQETVNVAFRLSPSPAASALCQALAAAPRLHTLRTQLPAVWNTTLLEVRLSPVFSAPPLLPVFSTSV